MSPDPASVSAESVSVASTDSPPTAWSRFAALGAGLVLGLTLLLTAFAWPAVRSTVHDVPLAVAGPPAAVAGVVSALDQQRPGAFEIHRLPDLAAAETAVRDRTVYGAVVVGSGPPSVVIASGASPVVAQGLAQLAAALPTGPAAPQSGATVPKAGASVATVAIRDLAPLPAEDPRGAGLSVALFPMVLGGLAGAVVLGRLTAGRLRQFLTLVAVTAVTGAAMAAVLGPWLGAFPGPFGTQAATIGLIILAISLPVLGLTWLLDLPGLGLGAATMMLVGNPLSAAASAPELLPDGWGELGQLLPPGAGASLLRSVVFFDSAGAGRPTLVLGSWIGFGLALGALSRWRRAPQ